MKYLSPEKNIPTGMPMEGKKAGQDSSITSKKEQSLLAFL